MTLLSQDREIPRTEAAATSQQFIKPVGVSLGGFVPGRGRTEAGGGVERRRNDSPAWAPIPPHFQRDFSSVLTQIGKSWNGYPPSIDADFGISCVIPRQVLDIPTNVGIFGESKLS